MKECYQFKDMNVLQHGYSVLDYWLDLMNGVVGGKPVNKEWRLPDWISEISLFDIICYDIVEDHLIYHGCGKPFCRTVDDEGRQHFPNHAEVSYRRYLQYEYANEEVANLIRQDMDAHTVKGDAIDEFIRRREAPTLLLAALCEIHSNSVMFGGLESTSFKIKWKHLNKIGKRLVEHLGSMEGCV